MFAGNIGLMNGFGFQCRHVLKLLALLPARHIMAEPTAAATQHGVPEHIARINPLLHPARRAPSRSHTPEVDMSDSAFNLVWDGGGPHIRRGWRSRSCPVLAERGRCLKWHGFGHWMLMPSTSTGEPPWRSIDAPATARHHFALSLLP